MGEQQVIDVLNKHLNEPNLNNRCLIGQWIDDLDDESKSVFEELKTRKNIVVAALYGDLIKSGVDLPGKLTTFRSHMRGYCSCRTA
jgi:hypothetical protein